MPTATILSVANMKGGVSKTSTGVFLATALARQGREVIYLDCDSQGSASEYRAFEQANYFAEQEPPYLLRKVPAGFLIDTIDGLKAQYDVIFVDLPRFTHGQDDTAATMMLTHCDGVLVPVRSGELDNMSTHTFVKILKNIQAYKREKGARFDVAAFASMTGQRPTDDRASREFMQTLGIPVLESELRNLREFAEPFTFESLLEKGSRERERFEPFFQEVTEFFNL